MNKTLLFGVALSITTCLTSVALAATKTVDSAQGPYYVRTDIGSSMPAKKINKNNDEYTKKHKSSLVFGVGAGYRVSDNFRTELNIAHRNNFKYSAKHTTNTTTTQKISITTAMINGFYDIVNYNGFTPYLTVGLGMARNNVCAYTMSTPAGHSITNNGKKQTNLAWNIGTGVIYKISSKFALDLGYKYVDFGKISTSSTKITAIGKSLYTTPIKGNLSTHEVTLGVVYNI